MQRDWELSTADDRLDTLPFRGTRKGAVREANELTALSGEKVYVQPMATTFTVPSPGKA